jgi:multiple sugar transport system permease protein
MMAMSKMLYTESQHRRMRMWYLLGKHRTAYAFLAPALILFIIFRLVPVFWTVTLSFQSGSMLAPLHFAGLRNWVRIFKEALAVRAIINTLVYMVMVMVPLFTISVGLALIMKTISRGLDAIRSIIYLPTLAPYVVRALVWIFMIHPEFGVLNFFARWLTGQPVNWLGRSATALPTIASLEIWSSIGYWTILFFAALLSLPEEIYEAARIDGAGAWDEIRHITLPLLRPTFLFAFVVSTIWNFQVFDPVLLLTDGGPGGATATVGWYIYKVTFKWDDPGRGAAMSVIMLVFLIAVSMIQMRLLRQRRRQ